MLSCPVPTQSPIIQLDSPMAGLVLHYDQIESVCESVGLTNFSQIVSTGEKTGMKVVILVSPSFYH